MNRSTALLPGRSANCIRAAISRWTSKVSRSSAPPREHVEMAADGEQEILGARELAQLAAGEQPGVDQFGNGAHAVDELADPEQGVKVAQPPLPLLHIGFDDIARIAHPLVPLVALGQLVGDEGARIARDHLGIETRRGLIVERTVAPHETRLEQRGAYRQILLRGADHLVERARRMADLQPKIPQRIELRLDHLLGPARLLERGQEADVDVAERRHVAAAIAADRDQRQPLARRRVARRIEVVDREIVAQADDLVGQKGGRMRRHPPCRRMEQQPAADLRAPRVERLPKQRDHRAAALPGIARLGRQRIEPPRQRAPVDNRAAVVEMGEQVGHRCMPNITSSV